MNLLGFGMERIWKGFRTGDPRLLALGAAALLWVWFRRPRPEEVVHVERLERGESLVIEMEPRRPAAGS